MKKILVSKQRFALVDDEDYDKLVVHKWWLIKGYAYTQLKRKTVTMQKMIMGESSRSLYIDHINQDRLDNRKTNLRYCTPAQNIRNQKKRCTNTSGYKGVSFDKSTNKYMAYITVDYKQKNLGRFDSAKAASRAYKLASKSLHGEFSNA